MHFEYLGILFYVLIAIALGAGGIITSVIVAKQASYTDKVSAYECGFDAFDDARLKFDVRFYLVGILFIIFDLEISFLFPWALTLKSLPFFGFFSMYLFLVILTVGFIYEWKKGALDWS